MMILMVGRINMIVIVVVCSGGVGIFDILGYGFGFIFLFMRIEGIIVN